MRLNSNVFATVSILSILGLAACSGGGSSSPSTPAVHVTPGTPGAPNTPSTTPTPAFATSSSSFSIQSYPVGLSVNTQNSTNSQKSVTPSSVTPVQSSSATLITISPSNGAIPFTFVTDGRLSDSHLVFYNQMSDTTGSIGQISSTSFARSLAFSNQPFVKILPSRLHQSLTSATRVVVRYRSDSLNYKAKALDIARSIGAIDASDIGPPDNRQKSRVLVAPTGVSSITLAKQLRMSPDVEYAEPEHLYYKQSSVAVTPNDTHFDPTSQWSMYSIKALNAWGYSEGDPNVSIAIIDTGLDFNLPDFAGAKVSYSESVINGVVTPGNLASQDTDGHGTNVAGIAAAGTNDGVGFAGAGFNTRLQIYKVFPDGTPSNSYAPPAQSGDVTQAIYDAVTHGANVISLSLGECQAGGADPIQQDAIAYAIAHNVVVVAAAGNERAGSSDPTCANSSTVDYPAAYDGVIAVGASSLDDSAAPQNPSLAVERVASYSNSGPGLTLVAPGGDPSQADITGSTTDLLHWIEGDYTTTAADPTQQCSNKLDCKALFAGTSQATPHVSGTVALMLALNKSLTPSQIKTILMSTADDINDPNQGSGRLDAYRALASVKGDSAVNPPTNYNFRAIAYTTDGSNVPHIVDSTFTKGVMVSSNGQFRIADVQPSVPSFKIGVWNDLNGDGKVDAGDYFGASQPCVSTTPCASAASIIVHPVSAGFVLQ